MSATLEIDATQFTRAMKHMAKLTGKELAPILRNEAGVILKTCAKRTKVAPVKKVTARARLRAIRELGYTKGDITVNAGVRGPYGRVWVRRPGTTRSYFLTRAERFRKLRKRTWSQEYEVDSREAVEDVKGAIKPAVAKAKKARALARQAWVQIADSLGIRLEAVKGGGKISLKSARTALATDGRHYRNGLGKEARDAKKHIITLINGLPYARKIKMNSLLARTINGRTKFFYQNLKRGVFRSQQATAAKYPGLYVK